MKISVIVPVYNMESFVEECIRSILKQTLSDIEIICVNDGSTDASLQILEQLQNNDGRLKIFSTRNRGVANARNLGISQAVGDFVCFIDPDDFFPTSNALKSLYEKSEGFDIVGGSAAIFDNKNKTTKTSFEGVNSKYTFGTEGEQLFSEYQFDYGFWRFLYRREFLISNNIQFPDLSRFQDPPFLVEAMIAAGKFYAIKDIVYCYRTNNKAGKNIWSDPGNVLDAIKGMVMVLEMAQANGLTDLFKTCLNHLDELCSGVGNIYLGKRQKLNGEKYWFIKKPKFLRK